MLARRYRRGAETLMHDNGRMLAEMKLFHSCLKNSLVFPFSLQRRWLNMKVFFIHEHTEGLLHSSCIVPVCSDTIKKKKPQKNKTPMGGDGVRTAEDAAGVCSSDLEECLMIDGLAAVREAGFFFFLSFFLTGYTGWFLKRKHSNCSPVSA